MAVEQKKTILNLYNSGITPDIIALQMDISQDEVKQVIENEISEEERKKINAQRMSNAPLLSKLYLDAVENIDSAIKNAQTRMWKSLKGKQEFNISMEETQNILENYAESKVIFVILHIDIVESTRLSMTLPVDRLATIVQAFTQEMSLLVQSYGGYVLKYVGDAIIAFFVSNSGDLHLPCINAINCARSMIKVIQEGVNPILEQNDYPEINVRIGIDAGENAVVQSGWDIHATDNTINNNKHGNHDRQKQIKKSHYDILSYTMNIATKMTALARPNAIVIGQIVYDMLDNLQKSGFAALSVSPDIWNYLSNDTGNVYQVYGNNLEQDRKKIQKMSS